MHTDQHTDLVNALSLIQELKAMQQEYYEINKETSPAIARCLDTAYKKLHKLELDLLNASAGDLLG